MEATAAGWTVRTGRYGSGGYGAGRYRSGGYGLDGTELEGTDLEGSDWTVRSCRVRTWKVQTWKSMDFTGWSLLEDGSRREKELDEADFVRCDLRWNESLDIYI